MAWTLFNNGYYLIKYLFTSDVAIGDRIVFWSRVFVGFFVAMLLEDVLLLL